MKVKPPIFSEFLLTTFCSYDFLSTALWDLDELYSLNHAKKGRIRADLLQYKEVLVIIYHLYTRGQSQHSPNIIAMLKNDIIVSARQLKRNKSYSIINVLGLSAGLLVFMLISIYTAYEFSYDDHQIRSNEIYRVYKSVNTINDPAYRDAGTPGPLAQALAEEFPEVVKAARLIEYRNILMEANGQIFIEPTVYPADPQVFEIFSFKALNGDVSNFLKDKYSIAISESVALKYFNRTDVVNEAITFQNQLPMTISGVFKDMPKNSHFNMQVLANFEGVMEAFQQSTDNWNNNPYFTYLLLEKGVDITLLEDKLPSIREKYAQDPNDEDGQFYTYFLQTLKEAHFDQNIQGGLGVVADAQRLYVFVTIAIAILIMACVNYTNLAAARVVSRMKEIGIKKVIGARKRNLVGQFCIESGLLVFMSLFISILSVYLVLPTFSLFVNRPLELNFLSIDLWVLLGLLFFGLTIVSGIYPALVSLSFNPANALAGIKTSGKKKGYLRSGLVVFQFIISSVLVIGAIVLERQMNYVDSLDTGYARDNILVLSTRDDAIDNQLSTYMDELEKVVGVDAVATSWSLPTNVTSNTEANWPGIKANERASMFMLGVTYDFFDLFEITIKKGRNFDPKIASDVKGIMLNETAVKVFGWKDPLGRQMITQNGDTGRVIGVVKDFHIKSLREEIEPLQIVLDNRYATLTVKINGDINETVARLETVYNSFSPVYPFEFKYFKDEYDRAYADDQMTAELSTWFTVLTILIACFGLYGLAAYEVQQRVKEVGIRKVFGASVQKIIRLLSKGLLKLLVMAFVIATPIAYYIMSRWLDDYAFHIDINFLTLFSALAIMFVVASFTVGYRTYNASSNSPIDALREE